MAKADSSAVAGYLDRLTPFNAVVASFAAWLFVFALAPIDPRWGDETTGYMLILLCVVGLLLGAKLPEAAGERRGESGEGSPLRLLILGDSAAAGVAFRNRRR